MTAVPSPGTVCEFRCGACPECLRCASRLAATQGTQVLLLAPCTPGEAPSGAAPDAAPGAHAAAEGPGAHASQPISAIVLCGSAAMAALEWFTSRRDEVAAAQQAAARAAHERLRELREREVHGV